MTIINYTNNFIFVKTNKTAGTSLEIALSKYCNEIDVIGTIFSEDEKIRKELGFRSAQNYKKKFYRINKGFFLGPFAWFIVLCGLDKIFGIKNKPALFNNFLEKDIVFNEHCPISIIQSNVDEKFFKSAFKFTIVRNPYDQIKSFYRWEIYRSKINKDIKFNDFLNKNCRFFFRNEKSLIVDKNGDLNIDHILKFEELNDGLLNLKKKIGLDLSDLFKKIKTKNMTSHINVDFDDHSIEIINKEADFFFKNFGYKKLKPNKQFHSNKNMLFIRMKLLILNFFAFFFFNNFTKISTIYVIKKFNFQFLSQNILNKFFYRILRIYLDKISKRDEYIFITKQLYHSEEKKFREIAINKYLKIMPNPGLTYYEYNEFEKFDYNLNLIKYKNLSFIKVFKCYEYVNKILERYSAKNVVLLQLGSASGQDLVWVLKKTKIREIISTDISNPALDFQKHTTLKNFILNDNHKIDFYKMNCLQAADLLKEKKFKDKIKIILGKGSLQYETPAGINIFFEKISKIQNIYLSISQPVSLRFMNNYTNKDFLSSYRGSFSFNHNYHLISKKYNMLIERYSEVELNDIININLMAKSN